MVWPLKRGQLFPGRWLVVIVGLAIQIGIVVLIMTSTQRSTFADVTLAQVAGKPSLCEVVSVTPFSEAAQRGLQPGTLLQALPGASGSGQLKDCQLNVDQIQMQTVGTGPVVRFVINGNKVRTTFDPTDVVLADLLAIIFSIVGIAIFLRAQNRPTARVAYSLFYVVSLMSRLSTAQAWHIPWISILFLYLLMLTNGLSTTFVCLFPHLNDTRIGSKGLGRWPYLPLIVGLVLMVLSFPVIFIVVDLRRVLFLVIFSYNIACLLVVIWVFLWGTRTVDKNERQIARVIMLGVAFLLVIIVINLAINPPDLFAQRGLLPSDFFAGSSLLHLVPFTLAVVPIICGYAMFRDQLLGATSLLSRRVTRGLLWILLASLFVLPSIILLRTLNTSNVVQEMRDYLYASMLVFSLLLFPLIWNKLRDIGDQIFYHDFYQYNHSLSELSTAMTSLQGLDQISAFLLPRLSQLLNAPDVGLLVRAISLDEMLYSSWDVKETTRSWHLYRSTVQPGLTNERLTRIADTALARLSQRSHEPLVINDVLLLTLYDGDSVSGFLCLGQKKNQEPYSRQDKSFLATLVAQLAVLEVNNRYLVQAQADAQKLAALNHRVISAQEDERRHLALDLHDDVLQEAMLLVRQLSDASTMSDVADAMPLARSVVINLRRTCLALRPSLLDELGLAEALRWLTRHTEQLGGGQIHLEMDSIGNPARRFSTTVELAFYRIAQEALSNIVKHAQASRVRLRLRADQRGKITLIIADNGCGFRLGYQMAESLGIVGMYERMDAIGGRIRLRTRPGRGVVICATYNERLIKDDHALTYVHDGVLKGQKEVIR